MKKFIMLLLALFIASQNIYAQRVFKEMINIEKNELVKLGYSKGIVLLQNDTLILCRSLSRIEVYDSENNLILEHVSKGKGPGELVHIWDALVYKKQLVVLDIVNNKVVFLTLEKAPMLIKEIPIRENAKKIFMINDTLIVQHLMKEYLVAEYDDNGNITSSYPNLNEEDKYNIFNLSGEMFYDKNMFYLFKSFNAEILSFKKKESVYQIAKKQFDSNTNYETKKHPYNDIKSNDVKVYTPPNTGFLYIHQHVDDKLIIQNIEQKKGADRIIDIYDWNSMQYNYSIKIDAGLNKGSTNMFFKTNLTSYFTRQINDYSIVNVNFSIK